MATVIVIDDDRVVRKILATALIKAGWSVVEAADGQEGIQKALELKPAAVICDLMMPRGNGFQVCRALREESAELPDLRIVVITARIFDIDRVNALESGADELLTKPVDVPKLISLLEQSKTESNQASPPSPAPADSTAAAEFSVKEDFIRFWGVRGSIPTPGPSTVHYGGNTSCVELRLGGQLVILDAGSGLLAFGDQLLREFPGQALNMTLLLTHTHWDHIQGFPFFAPAYFPKNQLRLIGYQGAKQGLDKTLIVQMESPFFPISLRQMPGNLRFDEQEELDFTIGPIKCTACFVNHPDVTMGYRLEAQGISVAYVSDHESYIRMRRHTKNAPGKAGEISDYAKSEEEMLEEFLRDVDVLIMDSQYTADEYATKVGWGHSCFEDTVMTAIKSGVKRLYLFHHDPRRHDDDLTRILGEARELVAREGSDLIVDCAREGVRVDLS